MHQRKWGILEYITLNMNKVAYSSLRASGFTPQNYFYISQSRNFLTSHSEEYVAGLLYGACSI